MNFDRRTFLKGLLGATTTAAVAPTYFFAPVGGWTSDVIINPANELPKRRRLTALDIIEHIQPGGSGYGQVYGNSGKAVYSKDDETGFYTWKLIGGNNANGRDSRERPGVTFVAGTDRGYPIRSISPARYRRGNT